MYPYAIQEGLEIVPQHSTMPPPLVARLLLERAGLHYDSGEATECGARANQAREIFEQVADTQGLAQAENLQGQAALLQKRFVEAREYFARAQALFEQVRDRIGVGIALNNLALALRRDKSDPAEALAERQRLAGVHFAAALAIRRDLDDRRGLAETLNNLGVLAFEKSEFDASWAYYLESLVFERQLDNRRGIGIALANLGEVAGEQEKAPLAARLLTVSEKVLAEIGSPLTEDVRPMLEEQCEKAAWSATELTLASRHLKGRPLDECCEWALQG
ncbi:tetratricopeptide repeat protein [Armatimonas sp.]|uniref:tetratricopeptide repeat protein n=1 Tax=Armatimonas sp. TaxID=1872638 RepID=UPI003750E9D2